MTTNLLRPLAVVFGLSVCVTAQAQTTAYQAPAKWSNFNSNQPSGVFRTVAAPIQKDAAARAIQEAAKAAGKEPIQDMPIPAFVPAEAPLNMDGDHVPQPMPEPHRSVAANSAGGCQTCQPVCCGPKMGAISPWFAGADVLFLTLANDTSRHLAVGDGTGIPYLDVSDVDSASATGFDAHIGRYFGCGRWGLDVGYFYFNPNEQSRIAAPAAAGGWYPAMPAWRDITVNPGVADTVWNHFDGAAAFRARRDLFFQGIEANVVGFGLMGARRVGACGPCGPLGGAFPRLAPYSRYGFFGGAAGPLARACSGRVQVQTLQGFRWFQLEDEFEFAANINGAPGYQDDDLYANYQTENNLFGYQIGSRVTYCVGCRLNIGIGGKIGLYGNHATYRQRIGTAANLAYVNTGGVDDVQTEHSKGFVSALGELDLGLGYRISNAWSIRGGYRLLSACGVATATGSIADNYSTLAASSRVAADDCVILHGGYVGLDYNW